MSDTPPPLPELETLCARCGGRTRFWAHEAGWVACSWCRGAGYRPTEAGEKILELVRHYLGRFKESDE